MIIHNAPQGSEAWERIRKGKATGSEFNRVITPAKLQFAAGARTYACQLAAERLGVESEQGTPSYWMDRGIELEPYARQDFATRCEKIQEVGFIMPTVDANYGCSVDGLVGDDGTLEIKCPSSELLIAWHWAGVIPTDHLIQCQFSLWVTGRSVCHFFGWHPDIEPLHLESQRDEKYMAAFESAMPKLEEMVQDILGKIRKRTDMRLATLDVELEGFDD